MIWNKNSFAFATSMRICRAMAHAFFHGHYPLCSSMDLGRGPGSRSTRGTLSDGITQPWMHLYTFYWASEPGWQVMISWFMGRVSGSSRSDLFQRDQCQWDVVPLVTMKDISLNVGHYWAVFLDAARPSWPPMRRWCTASCSLRRQFGR